MTDQQLRSIKNRLSSKVVDFARRVAPVYQLLEWKWWNVMPDEREIRQVLFELIENLEAGNGGQTWSSGGLLVGYEFEDGVCKLRMEMIIHANDYIKAQRRQNDRTDSGYSRFGISELPPGEGA